MKSRLFAVIVAAAFVLSGCSSGSDRSSEDRDPVPTPPTCLEKPSDCTLSEVADEAGVRVGVAVDVARLSDPAYAETVVTEFDSVTPEVAMKWIANEERPGDFDYEQADVLVDFAEEHGLQVRGHVPIWGLRLPDWVAEIDDPDELAGVLEARVTDVVGRYAGRVQRWDVVNEPLEFLGGDLADTSLTRLLGEAYIADAFRAAKQADPSAELWLNEHSGDISPEKGDSLVALVQNLVDQDVPIDGVGIQGHYIDDDPPNPETLLDLMNRLTALGVDVAITELDITVGDGGVRAQGDDYRGVVDACLQAGCVEITTWGVDDSQSWLGADAQALMFDDDFQPKPAYEAVRDAIARWARA